MRGHLALARANPAVLAAAVLAGAIAFVVVSHAVGAGIAVGGALAFVNSLLLSGRVEAAADTGDMARGLMVMQMGLIFTFIIVAVTTIILIKFSLTMTVTAAIAFGVTQLVMLAVFYFTHGRSAVAAGRQTT